MYETMFEVTLDVTPPCALIVAPETPSLEKIRTLQGVLANLPQVDCPLEHFFAPGMYVRKCTIPANSVVVGKMHRHRHPVFLMRGSATINTDRGMERIVAPHIWISQENAKRALVTHEDCDFVTVHLNPDDVTDLEHIEADVIVPEGLLSHEEQATLAQFADDLQAVYA